MGNGIGLRADEIVQSVDSVGRDGAVACPPGSLDALEIISVRRSDEYTKTNISDTSAVASKVTSTPSSPIFTPEVSAALYASRSHRRT